MLRLNLRFLIQTIEIYPFRIREDQHYIISSARDDDVDDDVGGVDIVAKSQRHQELRRSALCTSCNLQEVSAHKQQQVQLNLQLYPPDATDITVNTKVKINNNNSFVDITMHGNTNKKCSKNTNSQQSSIHLVPSPPARLHSRKQKYQDLQCQQMQLNLQFYSLD